MGDNPIHHTGHVRMMAAVQPFISGAISKTVNLPEEATVEEVEQLHIDAWKMGVKAIAIYRDNCKVSQPLSTAKRAEAVEPLGDALIASGAAPQIVEKIVEKRSEEHTSELQSLMRISYAVFSLKKKIQNKQKT